MCAELPAEPRGGAAGGGGGEPQARGSYGVPGSRREGEEDAGVPEPVSVKLLPQAEGPYIVERVTDKHNVYIGDPFAQISGTKWRVRDVLTGEAKPVNTAQLLRLQVTREELLEAQKEGVANPVKGDVVLVNTEEVFKIAKICKLTDGQVQVHHYRTANAGPLLKRTRKLQFDSKHQHPKQWVSRAALVERLRFNGNMQLTVESAAILHAHVTG